MRWLHRLLARIFGWTPEADASTALVCVHNAWTACAYYARKGKYGWWTQCTRCGTYRSCNP